jgi:hypothetical protein
VVEPLSCSSCAWCGLTRPVEGCVLHVECGPFDWAVTHCGQYAVAALTRAHGGRLPDAAFEHLAAASFYLWLCGEFPDADALTALVLDNRDQWEAADPQTQSW